MKIRNLALSVVIAATVGLGAVVATQVSADRPDVVFDRPSPSASSSATTSATPTSSSTRTRNRPETTEPSQVKPSVLVNRSEKPTSKPVTKTVQKSVQKTAKEKPEVTEEATEKPTEPEVQEKPEIDPPATTEPSTVRPLCASSRGTWPQVYDEEKGKWVCPPDPYKKAVEISE